ncbi:MAG: right-handed parallel beta-helix repeat-containing protein [Planctomycetota bacterium]
MLRKVFLMICLVTLGIGESSGDDFHVGVKDQPFATLHAAVAAARKVGADKPRRILVHAGTHFLPEPVKLDARDSGLTIEAAGDGEVVLCGGKRVTGWEKDGETRWSARVPDAVGRKWDFRMLVVNGRFCKRARYPKDGFLEHLTEFKVPWMSTTGGGWKRKPTQEDLTTMQCKPGDLGPWLDVNSAELTVYHKWDESVVGLAGMDEQNHVLRFSNTTGHPPGAFGVKKYVIWNTREGMTEPGQWYLDRTNGKVVYWPMPNEDMTTADVLAPTIETIISIAGSEKDLARGIVIRGLTLAITNTPLRAGGFGAGSFAGAVTMVHAEGCRLTDLKVVNVGGQAVKSWKSNGLRVENCDIHHIGAGGIRLGGDDNVIANNAVHHIGLTYPSGIAVSCGGCRNRIANNTVHDAPYSAITCSKDDNVIEGNRVHHCMQELLDGAAIYITFCKNVVVRGNFVSDIADPTGSQRPAYYLDEQAEGCLVEGNLALDVPVLLNNHMARNNTIRNNVFIAEGDGEVTFYNSSDYHLERNVIYAKGKLLFLKHNAIVTMPNNVFFSGAGAVEGEKMERYKPLGREPIAPREGTVIADPMFDRIEDGIVTFKPDSPALRLGIKPLDVSKAGRKKE